TPRVDRSLGPRRLRRGAGGRRPNGLCSERSLPMRRSSLLTLASAVLAAFVSMTSTASAQTATGQITGTARDASGAVMAGVKVIVTNSQTGLTRETKTG